MTRNNPPLQGFGSPFEGFGPQAGASLRSRGFCKNKPQAESREVKQNAMIDGSQGKSKGNPPFIGIKQNSFWRSASFVHQPLVHLRLGEETVATVIHGHEDGFQLRDLQGSFKDEQNHLLCKGMPWQPEIKPELFVRMHEHRTDMAQEPSAFNKHERTPPGVATFFSYLVRGRSLSFLSVSMLGK